MPSQWLKWERRIINLDQVTEIISCVSSTPRAPDAKYEIYLCRCSGPSVVLNFGSEAARDHYFDALWKQLMNCEASDDGPAQ